MSLAVGTQAQVVEELQGSSYGLRIAGWIFIALGLIPGVIFLILKLRRPGKTA